MLLILFGFNQAFAAFTIATPSNGASITYNSSIALTVAGVPGSTLRVDYYSNGTYVGSSTAGTTYSFSQTASVPGTYTVTARAYNNATYPSGTNLGTTTNTVTVTVYPDAPTTTGSSVCGSGAVTLTAADSYSGGTFSWYTAATGGTALQSSTSATYSPTVTATTTYYVAYTSGGVTSLTRTAVTATVNTPPNLTSMPTSGAYFSYPFSGNANDISGSGDNGTVQGGAPLTTDRFGNANSAYSFNGSTQYISTATGEAAPGPQNFSISVWFKTSSAGGLLVGYTASQTGSASQYDRQIYMSNTGALYFGLYSGAANTINTTATYADGNWHHVVATCSTTSGSNLYVDGALQATSAAMNAPETYGGVGYWRVAFNNMSGWPNAPTNQYFTGSLDDIATYNTTLTAAQVYATYGAGSSPACAGNPLTLQANTISGATYAWTGPNSFSSSLQNPTVSSAATTAMAGTYTCVITGSNGCTSSIKVTAVVNSATLPTSAFTATSPVIIGANSTITYSGTYSATSTYTWNFNGGTVASGSGVGPYTVNWSTPGAKTVTLTVTNSSGCFSTSTQTVTVGSYGNYAFSDPITLNTTSLGITANLTNFPALLSIQDNNLIISGTCSDKVVYPNGPNYDFAFYDPATSAELNYQVESYNQTTGTLLVWVQIPTLTYASNKAITFYYGSKTPSVTHNTAFYQGTWPSDYKAVFHFNESTFTGSVIDGTSGGNTGTANNMTSANLVTGKIGTAYSFNGSNTSLSYNPITLTGTFTISAWVKLSAINVDQKIMTNQAYYGGGSGGYKLGVYSNNYPETESGTAGDRGSTPLPTAFGTGAWHYVQGVYSGSTLSTYVDGAQYEIATTSNNPSSTTAFFIGVGEGGSNYYFNGIIDEPRVSNVAKSTNWIKAEYVNQNNPVTFTTVGSTSTNTTNAATIPGAITYTWTGAASTDPTVASNWNNTTAGTTGNLPAFDGSASLVIPNGLINYPVLTANAAAYGLTIANGATVNLNGFTLSIGCNIYNSSGGQILYGSNNASGITWNGSAATQTYNGTGTSNTAQLGNMTVNNSSGGTITISGGPLDVYNTLTITKGNVVVGASPAALTIKSTATLSGTVAAIPSPYTITGTVNVERYLVGGAGHRGYHLLSSPVYNGTANSNNVYSINYLINNVILTGTTGTTGGFDKAGNPTLYVFREDITPSNTSYTGGNFWGISKINNTNAYDYYMNGGSTVYNLPAGSGYMLFFRGDRSAASLATETTAGYVPVGVAVNASGTLTQGQVIVHDWYTPTSAYLNYTGTGTGTNAAVRGFNLVGNPYASSIDWEQYNNSSTTTGIYATANVSNTVYELNPLTYNYDTYQKGGASTNNGTKTIASGQGFFVLATNGTNPQLIFNESAKTSNQNTGATLFMSTRAQLASLNSTAPDQHLRIQLSKDSINTDDIYIGFNPQASANYVFNEDALYKPGTGAVSLGSMSADKQLLAINKEPLPEKSVTIPLSAGALADGQYTLKRTELMSIPALYEIWLMDAYKKDSLDMRANTSYLFNISLADTNSYGSHRFSLVIRQNPALGVHLLSFKGEKITTGSQLSWITENEANYTSFSVERSIDNGKTFITIGGFVSSTLGSYNFTDTNPAQPIDQYRLKLTDLNGVVTYSSVVTLMYANTGNNLANIAGAISIYPNPAKGILNLQIMQPLNSSTYVNQNVNTVSSSSPGASSIAVYGIKIVNSLGSVIKSTTNTGLNWQTDVSTLTPGTYVIQVVDNSSNKLVGKGTFVKL